MSKVGLHLGVTFAARPEDRGSPWFRVDVKFDDIDTDGDVGAQMQTQLTALEAMGPLGEGGLALEAANVSGLTLEGLGWEHAFGEFKENLKGWQKNVVAEVRRQKEILETLISEPTEAERDRKAATKAATKAARKAPKQ